MCTSENKKNTALRNDLTAGNCYTLIEGKNAENIIKAVKKSYVSHSEHLKAI